MKWAPALLGAILSLFVLGPAFAADFSDPDWPCVQRKVLRLSIGQMWAGVPTITEQTLKSWRKDITVAHLAAKLAIRRTATEAAASMVSQFAADFDGSEKNTRLALLFAGVFALIDQERADVIRGISRYAHKQADLANKIEQRRLLLEKLNSAEDLDFDQIEEQQDFLDWDTRIFRDRAQSLIHVCETPVILERRAFAISQMIQQHLN